MNWSKGFSARYVLRIVDRDSWQDTEEIPILSGSISRDIDSGLVESATVETRKEINEKWIRIYLTAEQNGESVHIPLFTGLSSSPQRDINGSRDTFHIDCYSVLKPAADWMTPLGYFVPAGIQGTKAIEEMLKKTGIKISYEIGAGILASPIVAEAGETYLSMTNTVLKAIGWRMYIDGFGEITLKPFDNDEKVIFSGIDFDSIEPELTDARDLFSTPNVLRVTADNKSLTIRDDDPASELSTVSRGREIWAEESIDLTSGQTLDTYAINRLKELQKPSRELSYKRRFHPEVRPGDLIRIRYPGQKIDGAFRVQNQKIDLTHGARTEEVSYES